MGDLVNRGPDSLGVLRRVRALGKAATTVLGNHDLHLLAAAAGHGRSNPSDTFDDVLLADDCGQLIHWLRHRPLLHWDQENARALVHAGIPAHWSLAQAAEHATEIEAILRGDHWQQLFETMYGDEPAQWSTEHGPPLRQRYTINALTRMRYITPDGALDFSESGPPDGRVGALTPWFRLPRRANIDTQIIFGHWAALGLKQENNVVALDSGCVWGGALSALPIDPHGDVLSVNCGSHANRPERAR